VYVYAPLAWVRANYSVGAITLKDYAGTPTKLGVSFAVCVGLYDKPRQYTFGQHLVLIPESQPWRCKQCTEIWLILSEQLGHEKPLLPTGQAEAEVESLHQPPQERTLRSRITFGI
jgi:hypothetical protein